MGAYINIHTHKQSSKGIAIINLANSNEISSKGFFSIGIHPWDINKAQIREIQYEIELGVKRHENIIAIGECGIDRTIETAIDKQIMVFSKQVELSEKLNLPLIVHCVKAFSDIIQVRKQKKVTTPWILHGYNSSVTMASQLIAKGCFVSFGQRLLNHKKLQNVFINIPIEYIFFETDNGDEKIENIYKKAAELRHICIDELKEQVFNNFKQVFKVNE